MYKSILIATSLLFSWCWLVPVAQAEDKATEPNTYVNSDAKAYAAMQALPTDQPFDMLNMIRYKDQADYKKNSGFEEKGWTGAEAYAEYSRHSSPIAQRAGGSVTYLGMPKLTMIGPMHEQWDAVFIVSYPNLAAFLALVQDPEYQKHAFHRRAAVADSRLIRLMPAPTESP